MSVIHKSANGLLDIESAWGWSKAQILAWFDDVASNPSLYGVLSEHCVSITRGDDLTNTGVFDEENEMVLTVPDLSIEMAVQNLRQLSENGQVSDITQAIWSTNILDLDNCRFRGLYAPFLGYKLPVRSAFDIIGWLLSITAVPIEEDVDQNNFFLPLLALFGKWCNTLLHSSLLPAVVHVSYWWENGLFRFPSNQPYDDGGKRSPRGRLDVLLGATPGGDQRLGTTDGRTWTDNPACDEKRTTKFSKKRTEDTPFYWGLRGLDIIRSRQQTFFEVGMEIRDRKQHVVNEKRFYESRSGFGRCAETFIFLLVLQAYALELRHAPRHPLNDHMRGFALKLTNKGGVDMNEETLDVERIFASLMQPCSGCRQLMKFLRSQHQICLFELHDAQISPAGKRACGLKCLEPGSVCTFDWSITASDLVCGLKWWIVAPILGIDASDELYTESPSIDWEEGFQSTEEEE